MSEYESSKETNTRYHQSHDVKDTLTKAILGYKEGNIPQMSMRPQEIAHIRFSAIMTGAMLYDLGEEVGSIDEKVDIDPIKESKEYLETDEIETFEDCLNAYLEPFRDDSFSGNSGSSIAGP